MEWYMSVLKNYAGFSGRARRKEYWMFILFNTLIMIGLLVIEALLGGPGIAYTLYTLAVLIPSIAVAIRRLHDTGRSGWWLLITLIPLVGAIVFLVFMCMEGDSSDNNYGSNPKLAAA